HLAMQLPRKLCATFVLPVGLLLLCSCSQDAASPTDLGSSGGTANASATGGDTSAAGTSIGGATGNGGARSNNGGVAGSGATSGGASSGTSGAGAAAGNASASNACSKANATCSGSNTGCNVGSYYLFDNQWNCGASSGNDCGPESAYGCLEGNTVSWVATSNQPAGNTAVLTYPAVQDNFDSKPLLSSFNTISATFEETSPHVGDYEVAWDCWFNDNANELMVWVDNYNQAPGGKKVATNVALGGRSYDIWWAAGSGTSGYLVFYATATFTSGTVDLLQLFEYAVTNGWLPASSTVNQLSFGIEICSTNGQDATWSFNNYSITAN
ncbi:MAG TPA: hypothetical protein VK745_08590, partial [Polyangiaceae bacterium]|nr:hypothetical protein [Polyangiaceae bacterium]